MRLEYRRILPVLLLAGTLLATGCAKTVISPPESSLPPVGQKTTTGATSKWQKPRTYTINGKSYTTMASAEGYVEEGIGSWYGKDFHGRKTANGEVYDMHGLSAAHKLLPFNTPVRVTNLDNGKSIVLRINDRGPFIKDRIIDLSYGAAKEVGMAQTGIARVRVEALGIREGSTGSLAQGGASSTFVAASESAKPGVNPETYLPEGRYYVQIGAFGKQENAQGLQEAMRKQGRPSRIAYDDTRNLWRVQVGPYSRPEAAESAKDALASVNDRSFVIAD